MNGRRELFYILKKNVLNGHALGWISRLMGDSFPITERLLFKKTFFRKFSRRCFLGNLDIPQEDKQYMYSTNVCFLEPALIFKPELQLYSYKRTTEGVEWRQSLKKRPADPLAYVGNNKNKPHTEDGWIIPESEIDNYVKVENHYKRKKVNKRPSTPDYYKEGYKADRNPNRASAQTVSRVERLASPERSDPSDDGEIDYANIQNQVYTRNRLLNAVQALSEEDILLLDLLL